MAFPATRMRRLRQTGLLRDMVRETELTPAHLVQPMFVRARRPTAARRSRRCPASSGCRSRTPSRRPARRTRSACPRCCSSACRPRRTSRPRAPTTTRAWSQLAVRAIKDAHPELVVITDVCLCALHRPRPLRRGARRRHASTTTSRSSCWPRPRSRTPRAGADAVAPERHDGRPRGRAARPARRRGPQGRRRSSPTRPSSPPPSTARSARPPTRRPPSATGAPTRWIPPTPTRRCARRCSTWRRAPTW